MSDQRSKHGRHTMPSTKDNRKALAAFIAKKAEIDTMLERLAGLSADHFKTDPDTLHWGHVGNLEFYASQLRRVTDAAFREGEHAE
jgi:hypothetical protein